MSIGLFPDHPPSPKKDPRPMLALMGELGMDRNVISTMLEVFCPDIKLSADDRRFLMGPIVVHDAGWGGTIPNWMIEQAGAERVEIVLGDKPWIIGPTELAAVMYGAMMSAPRGSDLTDLYLWAASTASARHYSRPIEELWQQLNMRAVADSDVLERSGRLWHDYQALANAARSKSIAEQAGREPKTPKRKQPAAPALAAAAPPRQFALF
jgi:hypothetical protein